MAPPMAFEVEAQGLVRLLESFYALEASNGDWFLQVLKTAGSVFERADGVGLLTYDVSGDVPRVERMDGVNVEGRNFELSQRIHAKPEYSDEILRGYRRTVCATLAEHTPNPTMLGEMRQAYAQVGLADQIMVNGTNLDGFGCALYLFSTVPIGVSAAQRAVLTRVATHLSAAYRLKRRLTHAASTENATIEAVFRAGDKRVEHRTEAVEAADLHELQQAVGQREWAKSASARTSGLAAASAWRPMVSARWSLVDAFERGGERFITARENVPLPRGIGALSQRERQVTSLAALGHSNKLIAYELGLAHSTVRVLLARAAGKLGTRTRPELIQQFRAES